mgnify:CR=1 FL=1
MQFQRGLAGRSGAGGAGEGGRVRTPKGCPCCANCVQRGAFLFPSGAAAFRLAFPRPAPPPFPMPSFLDYQEQARKRSRLFTVLWCASIAVMTAFFCAIALFAAAASSSSPLGETTLRQNANLLFAVALAVPAVVLLATLVKSRSLGSTGGAVARALGGRRVNPDTRVLSERRLLNIVEEMAIASRLPVPEVYVLDREEGINAFAAGYTPETAAVAVTRGALDLLPRDQLQAVIGHEFSHVLNGDMRLNIRMIGSIFGLVCIAFLGKLVFRAVWEGTRRSSRSREKDSAAALAAVVMAAGGAVWLVGSLGVLFGRLLQAAVGRQREYLADASSVEFTRNPLAMAGALETIGAFSRHGILASPHADEVAHFFFAQGVSALLFATHPPLEKRIARFDPAFRGDFREAAKALSARSARARTPEAAAGKADGVEEEERWFGKVAAGGAAAGFPAAVPRPVPSAAAGAIPEAIRTPAEAPCVLCAALLDPADGAVRAQQLAAIAACDAAYPARTLHWEKRLLALPPGPSRRAWCEIAASALKPRPEEERRELADLLGKLISADGRLTAFECALERLFRNRLLPPPPLAERPAAALADDAREVLFVLAYYGATDAAARRAAYRAGIAALPASFALAGTDAPVAPRAGAFATGLDRLRALRPAEKKAFLAACRAVVLADGKTTVCEDHLLHAVADTLGAPGAA